MRAKENWACVLTFVMTDELLRLANDDDDDDELGSSLVVYSTAALVLFYLNRKLSLSHFGLYIYI